MMKILVIDGQGGRLGRKLLENIRKTCPDGEITAVGTNSIATENMLNSNCADHLATGRTPSLLPAGRRRLLSARSELPPLTP
jgi:hypothetical protein